MCTKITKITGMIFGLISVILAIFALIGYFIWLYNQGSFLGVANFWNYLYAMVPFSLLSICCSLIVITEKIIPRDS